MHIIKECKVITVTYTTTKIKSIKSYPTYQFHAESASSEISVENIFKICILETFAWLRSRLEGFDKLPNQLDMPLPENYSLLDTDSLFSFSIDAGFTVDVVYVRSEKIWSFNITEPDMGANIGRENERLPAQGRTFSTDISFRMKEKCVEIGIRTICSEPPGTDADCEVFRPALVKSLAQNPLVGLKEYYPINGQPVEISTKNAVQNLLMYIDKYDSSLPVVIICDAGYKMIKSQSNNSFEKSVLCNSESLLQMIGNNNEIKALSLKNPVSYFAPNQFKVDMSKIELDIKKPFPKDEPAEPIPIKELPKAADNKEEIIKLDNIDYAHAAKSAMGYAHICFVHEQCIEQINRKIGTELQAGGIAIISCGEVISKYSNFDFENRLDDFRQELYKIIVSLPKKRRFSFGNIAFHTDARLLEIEEKRSETLSYEGKAALLTAENESLKQKISELEQLNTGKSVDSDDYRKTVKKLRNIEVDNDRLEHSLAEIKEKFEAVSTAYKASCNVIDFYRQKSETAAHFPDDKNDVCEWIERNFGDTIVVSANVKSEMKKYSGEMDTATLCDGILFLHGYALYRNGIIDGDTLRLYAESGGWQAEGCGSEALKVYRDDYTIVVDSKKYLLDMHIKYGVNPRTLIRVYFCYDESFRKIIIGHMPAHLATLKQST